MFGSKVIIIISGKRYSGKDTVADIIMTYLNDWNFLLEFNSLFRIAIADTCKRNCGRDKGLDAERLINDREYKEIHRNTLTEYLYSEVKKDFFIFERKTLEQIRENNSDIVLVTDCRMKYSLKYFRENANDKYKFVTIRINASDEAKQNRGWVKTPYDDSDIETDLDDVTDWDIVIDNSSSKEDLIENVKNNIFSTFL